MRKISNQLSLKKKNATTRITKTKEDQKVKKEIQFFQEPQSRWKNFKYAVSVFFEFIKGFRALHFVGPCVTVFGSARFKEDHPFYKQARELSGANSATRFYDHDRWRPRHHGSCQPRRERCWRKKCRL